MIQGESMHSLVDQVGGGRLDQTELYLPSAIVPCKSGVSAMRALLGRYCERQVELRSPELDKELVDQRSPSSLCDPAKYTFILHHVQNATGKHQFHNFS